MSEKEVKRFMKLRSDDEICISKAQFEDYPIADISAVKTNFCLWKMKGESLDLTEPHFDSVWCVNEYEDWKYCPYCGKPILKGEPIHD